MKTNKFLIATLAALLASGMVSCGDDDPSNGTYMPDTNGANNQNGNENDNGNTDNESGEKATLTVTVPAGTIGTDGLSKKDNYASYAGWDKHDSWNLANCHDPSVTYYNGYYYMYGTDASYGNEHLKAPQGKHFQGKRSKDLVNWGWVGGPFNEAPSWVLDSINSYRSKIGLEGTLTYNDIKDKIGYWAPVVRTVNGKIRMYYSIVCDNCIKTGSKDFDGSWTMWSFIGMCETTDPENDVWYDKGFVTCSSSDKGPDGWARTSTNDWNAYCYYNAIDPTYIVTPSGEHWLIHGSWHSGFTALQIDANTGKPINPVGNPWFDNVEDLQAHFGKRISTRGISRWQASEAPEVIYKDGYYYLFMAWDGLDVPYNTRVVRTEENGNVDGPYFTSRGANFTNGAENTKVYPIVTHPYKFKDGVGWVGIAHCCVFQNEETKEWFYMSQGRAPKDVWGNAYSNALMMGHVRKIVWCPATAEDLNDLWPIALPERYANVEQTPIKTSEIAGKYELINLAYKYAQQIEADEDYLVLNEDGTMTGPFNGTWEFDETTKYLKLTSANGQFEGSGNNIGSVIVCVERERDWEKGVESTLVFAGFHKLHTNTFWGKKVE
ncbi:MAG: glycoside hydrolase family 43 protein [Bacteroidales bacterium]|nr:glycoside hydrolase family 43 protein [Bacteroidales bacterium]